VLQVERTSSRILLRIEKSTDEDGKGILELRFTFLIGIDRFAEGDAGCVNGDSIGHI
jgi:hypothetical protein